MNIQEKQQKQVFEIIGRLYLSAINADEQIRDLTNQLSELQQAQIKKPSIFNEDEATSSFIPIDEDKMSSAKAPEQKQEKNEGKKPAK